MGYVADQGQVPSGTDSWIESTLHAATDWIASLFGGQAEERDRRRMEQNEKAFRAAAAGDLNARSFLRARTGLYGTVYIPVSLPWAVSPSSGEPETPGDIGGWATGPAKRHAEALFDGLESWAGDPGSIPTVDAATERELYDLARTEGRDVAEAALQALAAALYGRLPEEYRQAVERGVRDHYAPQVQTAGVGLLMAAGLGLALLRSRR